MADSDTKATKATKESASVAETIKNAPGIDEGTSNVAVSVQSTTEALPAESPGSQEVGPSPPDTEPEAPPLHTGKPDVPIAQVLTAGAGEHTPPDPDEYAPSGRPKDIEEA